MKNLTFLFLCVNSNIAQTSVKHLFRKDFVKFYHHDSR
ncbi:hypothetical protein VPHF86_0302 [Vibrio phage F86]